MDCKMYESRHLFYSAQGHDSDAQADEQRPEDRQAYREIVEDVKGSEVASVRFRVTSEEARIQCWSDADFSTDKADSKSVSGFGLTMDEAVVLWLCKKKLVVSLNTMEGMFISASQAGRELLGTKELLNELRVRLRDPLPMWIHSQAHYHAA